MELTFAPPNGTQVSESEMRIERGVTCVTHISPVLWPESKEFSEDVDAWMAAVQKTWDATWAAAYDGRKYRSFARKSRLPAPYLDVHVQVGKISTFGRAVLAQEQAHAEFRAAA